jgi:hypothetical protein
VNPVRATAIRAEETMSHLRDFIYRHQRMLTFILIGLLAIYAVSEMVRATPFGPAFGSDSVTYMESAKNFVSGTGLGLISPDGSFRLLPYTPPLYPLVLSILHLMRLNLVQAAFWVNAALYIGLIFILGWSMWHILGSMLSALVVAAMLAFSAVLININIWIMADSLCLTLGMGGLVLMLVYLKTRSRKAFFWSAALTGMAFLTRYAGIAYCATGALGVILFGSQPFKKRLIAGSLYGFLSVFPNLIWLAIELPLTGGIASRSLLPANEVIPGMIIVLKALKEAVYLWLPFFFPLSQSIGQVFFRLIYIGVFLIIVFAIAFAFKKLRNTQPGIWHWESGFAFGGLFILFLGLYFCVISLSYALYYPQISLTNRMFAPINVGLLVIVSIVLGVLYKTYRAWPVRLIMLALTILLLVGFCDGGIGEIARSSRFPLGYARFNDSGLVVYLQALPKDTPIISDKAPLILYYTGRPAYAIQEFFTLEGQQEFLPYGSNLEDEGQLAFREQGGALVLTVFVQDEFLGLYKDLASERFATFVEGLYLAYRSPEGEVYFYQPPE